MSSLSKYLSTFAINKMWDESWLPLEHVDFTNKPFIEHDTEIDGEHTWDLKNKHGYDVAPGLYIYTVETLNNLKKIGKFAIVR